MPELEFTESEMEAVTVVFKQVMMIMVMMIMMMVIMMLILMIMFKQYETGLREACIDVKEGLYTLH